MIPPFWLTVAWLALDAWWAARILLALMTGERTPGLVSPAWVYLTFYALLIQVPLGALIAILGGF